MEMRERWKPFSCTDTSAVAIYIQLERHQFGYLRFILAHILRRPLVKPNFADSAAKGFEIPSATYLRTRTIVSTTARTFLQQTVESV